MATHYRTQGFILKKTDRGEADQLFTIYTRDFGKLEILGKAIRKITSKLRAGAELFYLLEIEFIQGKTHKTLTDVILIEKFQNIRQDLQRLEIAFQIAEVLDKLAAKEEKDEKIWVLLKGVFDRLNNLRFKVYDLQLIYFYFAWNLLSLLGYLPELYNCSICRKKLTIEPLYFSQESGGIICKNCSKGVQKFQKIDIDTVEVLRTILRRDWVMLHKLKIGFASRKLLKNVSKTSIMEIIRVYEK